MKKKIEGSMGETGRPKTQIKEDPTTCRSHADDSEEEEVVIRLKKPKLGVRQHSQSGGTLQLLCRGIRGEASRPLSLWTPRTHKTIMRSRNVVIYTCML